MKVQFFFTKINGYKRMTDKKKSSIGGFYMKYFLIFFVFLRLEMVVP